MDLKQAHNDLALEGLAGILGAACDRAAEPAEARTLSVQMLSTFAEHDRAGLEALWNKDAEAVCRVLAVLGGAAPFLLRHFGSDTRVLASLVEDDLSKPRRRADYVTRLAARLDGVADEALPGELRRFKYEELARITLRDLCDDLVPVEKTGETLAEVSHLADALLSRALEIARARIARQVGPPLWYLSGGSESFEPGFAVLGLGKLGSEELNYSSDVDLVYVYQSPPGSLENGPRDKTPGEYFARLAQAFGRIVSEVTPEGFLYRVDLDLRPEGKAGPLVIASENYLTYFEAWADTWEKAAFMKARVVAGDEHFGWRVVRAMDPMIYSGSIDYAGLEAIKDMKRKVEADQERKAKTFNVKLGSGGIRDVEFIAQAAQLLHGGRIPQIRLRGTQETLRALADVNLYEDEEVERLLQAYWFLRRTENRLQMVGEQQTHALPDSLDALARLARAMGFLGESPVAEFEKELGRRTACVHELFTRLFFEEEDEQVLSLFARSAQPLLTAPGGGPMIEALAARLAVRVRNSADPERALNNLSRFIEGVGSRSFYYGLLLDRPELIDRLVRLFAGSDFLSSFFAAHPRLVESVFADPNVLLLTREQLETDAEEIARDFVRSGESELDEEGALDALRAFVSREVLNTGLLDLDEKVSLAEAEEQLTDVAEVCVDRALSLSKDLMARRGRPLPDAAEFLIVGMGKFGSRELSYGSDLDVIFFYDECGADSFEVQDLSVRLAQKLINVIQTRTAQGICYEIDARLRPSGRQGMLVVSLESFCKYHEKSAAVWERQALLRARAVAGSDELARGFERARREVLLQELPTDFAEQVRHVRGRMENELAQETAEHRDLKTGRGGILDVEAITQYLQLLHARAHTELIEPIPTARVIDRLAALELLGADDAAALGKGWQFLKKLSARLRIVENRSISEFDHETGDLTGLALRMGYEKGQRDATVRRKLLDDYRRHTETIREVYARVLGE